MLIPWSDGGMQEVLPVGMQIMNSQETIIALKAKRVRKPRTKKVVSQHGLGMILKSHGVTITVYCLRGTKVGHKFHYTKLHLRSCNAV